MGKYKEKSRKDKQANTDTVLSDNPVVVVVVVEERWVKKQIKV